MKCNHKTIRGNAFAYDGCHKIYVLENQAQIDEATEDGFQIHDIIDLPYIYADSCPLRFISYWDVSKPYICPQGVEAHFSE